MRLLSRTLFAAVVLALAGCDSPHATPPGAPSGPPPASPATVAVTGSVVDTARQPIADVLVEALDGVRVMTVATTDAAGKFSFSGTFNSATEFRATKPGYQAAIQPMRTTIFFMLPNDGPRLDLAGKYTLLVEADSSCTDFPAEFRTRVYDATVSEERSSINPAERDFIANLIGSSIDAYYHFVVLEVVGDYVTFDLSDNYILDEVAPETYFAVGGLGAARATTGNASISVQLNGAIDYCVTKSEKDGTYPCTGDMVTHATCDSKNHRLTLTLTRK